MMSPDRSSSALGLVNIVHVSFFSGFSIVHGGSFCVQIILNRHYVAIFLNLIVAEPLSPSNGLGISCLINVAKKFTHMYFNMVDVGH